MGTCRCIRLVLQPKLGKFPVFFPISGKIPETISQQTRTTAIYLINTIRYVIGYVREGLPDTQG